MGKYGEAIGIWDLKVGGADLQLKPKKGDNLKLLKLMQRHEKDSASMMEAFAAWIKEVIKRDVPPVTPLEEEELDEYVEFNVIDLLKETMIVFRYTTKDKLEEAESEQVKKIISHQKN